MAHRVKEDAGKLEGLDGVGQKKLKAEGSKLKGSLRLLEERFA